METLKMDPMLERVDEMVVVVVRVQDGIAEQ